MCRTGSQNLDEEKEHLKGVLQANGYPRKEAQGLLRKKKQSQGSRVELIIIPYVKGLGEMI